MRKTTNTLLSWLYIHVQVLYRGSTITLICGEACLLSCVAQSVWGPQFLQSCPCRAVAEPCTLTAEQSQKSGVQCERDSRFGVVPTDTPLVPNSGQFMCCDAN